MRRVVLIGLCLVGSGCAPDFSPNTYSTSAVQQAAKVEQGVVIGVRQVGVTVSGNVGAATGGAAGAIAGSQLPGSNATSALGALGGTLIGGVIGSSVERAAGDTEAFEYVVRTAKGDLVSVTQTDKTPLAVGQHVLVIAGPQARIVSDYTTSPIAVAPEPVKPAPVPAPVSAPTPAPASGPPSAE
jgi:outer membrane lipoprotein SlyB